MKVDVSAIETQLWPHGSNRDVYMVLDGARDRRIYSDLMNSHLIYSCLYSGDIAYEIEIAAPHLVQLEYEDKSTRSLIQRAWGNSWGIFLKSDARMERLRRHLRTFLTVKSWRGRNSCFGITTRESGACICRRARPLNCRLCLVPSSTTGQRANLLTPCCASTSSTASFCRSEFLSQSCPRLRTDEV